MTDVRTATIIALGIAAAVVGTTAATAAASEEPAPSVNSVDTVRINEVQTIHTHNSYHREVTDVERLEQSKTDQNYWTLQYSHSSLPVQFSNQSVRGLEIDLYPDPVGGLYTFPNIRRLVGFGPLAIEDMDRPGFKVMHMADHDYNTNCWTFQQCLAQARTWSDAHPTHYPIGILLEMKRSTMANGQQTPAWTNAMMDAMDAEIRNVFTEDRLITPDDLLQPGLTLEQSVVGDGTGSGWPTLADAQGKIMFFINNNPGQAGSNYLEGHPSLTGRVAFTNSRPGRPESAWIGFDQPKGFNLLTIQDFVRRGYLVRTRADENMIEAQTGDTIRRDAALASGAQMISTDFPISGLSSRYGADYVAELPNRVPVHCNPINTDETTCQDAGLELPGAN